MIQALEQGLLITLIGMGLVLLMIIILWGIMVLLVSLTNKPKAEEQAEPAVTAVVAEPSARPEKEKLAAAIAVAGALQAVPATRLVTQPKASQAGSQWLSSGRTQQILSTTNKGRKA